MAKKSKLKKWKFGLAVVLVIAILLIFAYQFQNIDTSSIESENGCQASLTICIYQFDPARSSIRVIDNNSEWIVSGDCVSTVGERFSKFGREFPTVSSLPPAIETLEDCLDRINFSRLHWIREFNMINVLGIQVEQHRFLFIDRDEIVDIVPDNILPASIIGG